MQITRPNLIDAFHNDHEDRRRLPELDGHGLCHVVTALLDINPLHIAPPATHPVNLSHTLLITRSLPHPESAHLCQLIAPVASLGGIHATSK
jgi:hypothetical protein